MPIVFDNTINDIRAIAAGGNDRKERRGGWPSGFSDWARIAG